MFVSSFRRVSFSALWRNAAVNESKARWFSVTKDKKVRRVRSVPPVLSKIELEEALLSPPLKPKRIASAYNLFVGDVAKKMKNKNETFTVSQLSKICSDKWKSMTENEKKNYENEAEFQRSYNEDEVEKYSKLMQSVVKVKDVFDVVSRIMAKANERKASKKLSPYNLFVQKEGSGHTGKLNFSEISKQWHALDEETKNEYKEMAKKINAENMRSRGGGEFENKV